MLLHFMMSGCVVGFVKLSVCAPRSKSCRISGPHCITVLQVEIFYELGMISVLVSLSCYAFCWDCVLCCDLRYSIIGLIIILSISYLTNLEIYQSRLTVSHTTAAPQLC